MKLSDTKNITETLLFEWDKFDVGETFGGVKFSRKIKMMLNMIDKSDDTILRVMRKLKKDRKLNYSVYNKYDSVYMKKRVEEQIILKQGKDLTIRKRNTIF